MDLLKRELQKKRKAARLESAGKSFVRWSELEQKQQLQKRRDEHRPKASPSSSLVGLTRDEVIRRLRVLREPATLFGEGDAARAQRLNLALRSRGAIDDIGDFVGDTIETRKRHKAAGIRDAESRAGGGDNEDAGTDLKSLMEAKFDELCKEDKILVFFSRLLDQWKQQLDDMPELEKRTANGKRKVARFNQSAQSLAALFEFCRKKILPDDIRQALLDIVECCMRHDYLLAEEQYIKLAIGNAAWPIGVTMVGIHERSAREKISTNSIAHIMNDETTRRYLQSVKRLMTLCETGYLTLP